MNTIIVNIVVKNVKHLRIIELQKLTKIKIIRFNIQLINI